MKQKLGSFAIHRHMADPKRPAIIGLSEEVYNNNLRYCGLHTDSLAEKEDQAASRPLRRMTTSPRLAGKISAIPEAKAISIQSPGNFVRKKV